MAESVDALVSNTSGVTGLKHQWSNIHPGSTPGLGTRKRAKCLTCKYLALSFLY